MDLLKGELSSLFTLCVLSPCKTKAFFLAGRPLEALHMGVDQYSWPPNDHGSLSRLVELSSL